MRSAAARSAARGRIRPLAEDDLEPVVALHRRTFGAGEIPAEALPGCLRELFFRHPWPDERVPSLVYEDGAGEVVGCLGVMPRPMTLGGDPVLAAVSHNFMVAPERRSTPVAFELMRGRCGQSTTPARSSGCSGRWRSGGTAGRYARCS